MEYDLDIQKACRLGNADDIREILHEIPAAIRELDPKLGWTPLYRAVLCGHLEATQVLIEYGADPNVKNKIGEGPLHQAADNGQYQIAEILLNAKADPNIQTTDGDAPLHLAAFRGDLKMCSILISRGANPNIINVNLQRSPLHYAVDYNHQRIVELLLQHDGNPMLRDAQGKTCLDYATTAEVQSMLANPSKQKASPSPVDIDVIEGANSPHCQQIENLNAKIRGSTVKEGSGLGNDLLDPDGTPIHAATEILPSISPITPDPVLTKAKSYPESPPADSQVYEWLQSIRLEEIYPLLAEEGYDDSEVIIEQLNSNEPFDDKLLQSIGIDKIGHRMRLLCKLHNEVSGSRHTTKVAAPEQKRPDSQIFGCVSMPAPAPTAINFPTFSEWMESHQLGQYIYAFQSAGLDDLEQICMLQMSDYRITPEILTNHCGMTKQGHRTKFLQRIDKELRKIPGGASKVTPKQPGKEFLDDQKQSEVCRECVLM